MRACYPSPVLLSVPLLHRAARPRATGSAATRNDSRARALVEEHGWNSTAHQVLDPGMRHWFSRAGDAVVGYAQIAGYRVVAGAPVAAGARLLDVAEEFEAASRRAGQRVCYFGAEERFAAALDDGHGRHLIGYQPTWDLGTWASRYDSDKSLRAQRNRAANKGVWASEMTPEHESSPEVAACRAAWLAGKRLPRLGFLAHSRAAGNDAGSVAGRRLFVARLPDTSVAAYLTACPVPGRHGWLIDKVVRTPGAPNGTAELLIDTAARALAPGSRRLTLGLAPLSWTLHLENGPGAPSDLGTPGWLTRLERLAVRHGRRFYDFAGLYAFKRKFRPDAWEPVYLLRRGGRLGPGTMLALAGAFLLA